MARLTREESQALTRTRLLEAAASLFAEKGYEAVAVEEIAERAGYSRGAFYSNFADKAELFLAVYDQHTAQERREITEVLRRDLDPGAIFESLQRRSEGRTPAARRWVMLSFEFWLYAVRNRKLRPKLASRFEADRTDLALAVNAVFGHLGIELPMPAEHLASLVMAIQDGLAMQRMIDADALPSTFYFDTLALLVEAARSLQSQRSSR